MSLMGMTKDTSVTDSTSDHCSQWAAMELKMKTGSSVLVIFAMCPMLLMSSIALSMDVLAFSTKAIKKGDRDFRRKKY